MKLNRHYELYALSALGRSDPIEIMSGDSLTGLKLVLTEARSSLRGKIQFADGSTYSQLCGSAVLYADKQGVGWGNVDPSGNFLIEKVPAGVYRLVITFNIPGTTPQSTHSEQTVELTAHQLSQVNVWLNPEPIKTPPKKPDR